MRNAILSPVFATVTRSVPAASDVWTDSVVLGSADSDSNPAVHGPVSASGVFGSYFSGERQ